MNVYWLMQRSEQVEAGDHWLSGPEQAHQSRLRFAKRREDWRLGRWTAKCALIAYHKLIGRAVTAARYAIIANAKGAPEPYLDGVPLPITISISHRDGCALVALAAGEVALGADLEKIEARTDTFIADYFTASEREMVRASAAADRDLVACLCWSAKESVLKALQVGLRADTRSVSVESVTRAQSHEWQPLAAIDTASNRRFHGWWRQEHDYLITMAAEPAPLLPSLLNQ